jgi:hypothetical protein
MSGNANKTISSVKGFSTLVRPRFGPGMLLQHDDLEQLSSYTRELSRLLFRSFFGCGVVCGLCVKVEPKCGQIVATVGAGLALDCTGDPIYVPSEQSLPIDEKCDNSQQGPLWVVLCGTTKCCSPRTSMCSTDDDEAQSVCTRERDAFEIRIVSATEFPNCVCGCKTHVGVHDSNVTGGAAAPNPGCQCANPIDECYQDHYQGICGCGCKDTDGSGCCGSCVLLAQLTLQGEQGKMQWTPESGVRRFIRPVLVRDPGCLPPTDGIPKATNGQKKSKSTRKKGESQQL